MFRARTVAGASVSVSRSLLGQFKTFSSNESLIKSKQLLKQVQARILTSGPITVADYMKEVLTNPTAGYYMTRDVFGQKGDFITSPEISQVFGELIAVWLINEWSKAGQPKPFQIVELGPGRGTLMSDILRVFSKFGIISPGFQVNLVEVSPTMSQLQEEKLGSLKNTVPNEGNHYKSVQSQFGCPVYWYHHLNDVPEAFTLYLAHEFFDALPIHKLVKKDGGWREVLIDMNPSTGTLRYVISRDRTPACTFIRVGETRTELEISPQSLVLTQLMASRIHRSGGIGLIIDYGHEGTKTDTFRAFRHHRQHDPLVEPGSADLTADVDFSALKWAAQNPPPAQREADEWKANLVYGTVDQGTFLQKMGIGVRLQKLLSVCPDANKRQQLESACAMLTDSNEMGGKFKCMALFPAVLEKILARYPPYGFD